MAPEEYAYDLCILFSKRNTMRGDVTIIVSVLVLLFHPHHVIVDVMARGTAVREGSPI